MRFSTRHSLSALVLVLALGAATLALGQAVCTVTPDSLNFGNCWVGDYHAYMPVTIANTGDEVLEATIHHGERYFFPRDLPDGHAFTLAPGEEMAIEIEAYNRWGHRDCWEETIVIDGGGGAEIHCFAVFQWPATTTPIDCSFYPTRIDFGAVTIGETSDPFSINVSTGWNVTTAAVTVTDPAVSGDFHFTWPGEYLVTSNCDFQMVFRPTTVGPIEHLYTPNTLCSGIYEYACLAGFGVHPYPAVAMDSAPIEVGAVLVGQAASASLKITNMGNETASGIATVTGEGFFIPEDRRIWAALPGKYALLPVYFTPETPGEVSGVLDPGCDLCATVPVHATGIEPSSQSDVIGLYFEQSGQMDSFQTTGDFEEVTAYLMIHNPSATAGISGWECCVEMAGAGMGLTCELAGEAMNVDAAPCFVVGMTGYPLLGENLVTLATLRFVQPSPDDATWFYIHPATQPSLPDVACYVQNTDVGSPIPLDWASGGETVPVAVVNEPGLAGVDDAPAAPVSDLSNYPNPFNPGTTISFVLGADLPVTLRVYDLGGRVVKTLLAGEVLEAGRCEIPWDGRDEGGRAVAAGIYVYRIEAGKHLETKRMALVK